MIDPEYGWRAAFLIGAVLALVIFFMRLSAGKPALADDARPRRRGRAGRRRDRAARSSAKATRCRTAGAARCGCARARTRRSARWCTRCCTSIAAARCSALALMAAQAFCYNAIFFTYALVLTEILRGPERAHRLVHAAVRGRQFPRAAAAGRLFDTLGRRPMIAVTYALSGVLLALTGWLFAPACWGAREQTLAWTVIFFFASAAASSAYLTVGESFPLEMRAMAIALFYAFGTGVGGVAGPLAVRRADRHRLAHDPVGLSARRRADGARRGVMWRCASRPSAGRWKRWRGRSRSSTR